MNTSKFSLADLLNVLSALVFSFVCYLGYLFQSVGDIQTSVSKSVFAAVILIVTAFAAKLLKQTGKHFKTYLFFEIFVVILFSSIIIFYTINPFSHYFAVSNEKVKIQNGITSTVRNAETMFKSYEEYVEDRKNRYAEKLESAIHNQHGYPADFQNMGFLANGINLDKQKEEKLRTINGDLYPQNYVQIKAEYENLIKNARSNVEVWKPMAVVSVVKHLDEKIPEWNKILKSLSKQRASGEIADDFNIEIDVESVKSKFSDEYSGTISAWLFAIFAWLLMLLPYFIAKRDGKRLTSVEKYEVVL